jgi:hypothetical protein
MSLQSVSVNAFVIGASMAVTFQGTSALAVTFDFTANSQTTTSTASFTSSGIALTVDQAQGVGQPGVASLVGSGGINRDINNGLCAAFLTGPALTGTNRCQYPASTNASLTGFNFKFDQDVILKSLQVFRPGGTTSGSLAFTAGSLSETLVFSNPGGAEFANGIPSATLYFGTPFFVSANTPITVDTSGTQYLAGETGGFRINNLVVDPVPGPLPVLGALAAFSKSRKLRKRLALAK